MVLLLVSMNTYLLLELRNLVGWRNILHSLSYNRIVVPRISIDISDRIQTRNRITIRTSFESGFRQTETISIWSAVSWSWKLNKYSFIEISWILKIQIMRILWDKFSCLKIFSVSNKFFFWCIFAKRQGKLTQ